MREILTLGSQWQLSPDSVVFDEGQPAGVFYLLLSGHVRLVRMTTGGDQIIVLYVPAGEVFGIGAPLGTATRQETAIASGDCVVLSWPAALWQVFADRYDGFATESLRSFGARSGEMSNRIVELSTKQVEQRIACALLRLVSQCGHKVESGVEIMFPLSRQSIADTTGATLHTVSRALSAWEKCRVIESARRHIVVTDPHRLVMIANASGRSAADRPDARVPVAETI